MPVVFTPSKRTTELWGCRTCHPLRIESIALTLSCITLWLTILNVLQARDSQRLQQLSDIIVEQHDAEMITGGLTSLYAKSVIVSIVSFLLHTSNLYWYYIHALQPLWTLTASVTMLGGWVTILVFWTEAGKHIELDKWDAQISNAHTTVPATVSNTMNTVLSSITNENLGVTCAMSASAAILASLYLSYFIISACAMIEKSRNTSRSFKLPGVSAGGHLAGDEEARPAAKPPSIGYNRSNRQGLDRHSEPVPTQGVSERGQEICTTEELAEMEVPLPEADSNDILELPATNAIRPTNNTDTRRYQIFGSRSRGYRFGGSKVKGKGWNKRLLAALYWR